MNDNLSYSSLGLYSSSFLKMYLNTDENLENIFALSDPTSAAFLHEYVHFLQDITTIYGLQNSVHVVQYIKYVSYKHRKNGDITLKIPVKFDKDENFKFYEEAGIRSIAFGTSFMDNVQSISEVKLERKNLIIGEILYEALNVELDVMQNGQNVKFQFGSKAINEGMAFLIEQYVYPDIIPKSSDFIYAASKMIIKKIYPILMKDDDLNIIALCDASLMYAFPGYVFVKTLDDMKQEEFIPSTAEDIYTFVETHNPVSFHTLTDLKSILNNQTLTAFNEINDYFNTPELNETKQWIEYTFLKGNEIRNNKWGFVLDLCRSGKISKNPFFKDIYLKIGIPLTSNNLDDAYFYSPLEDVKSVRIRPDMLWAVNQIYNIFINSSNSKFRRCSMFHWCQNAIPDNTSQECFDAPWEKVNQCNCPFTLLWKAWDFSSFIPVE